MEERRREPAPEQGRDTLGNWREQLIEAYTQNFHATLKLYQDCIKKCPVHGEKFGALPGTPTDIFVAVDNRPQTNVCVPAGQNPHETASALGLSGQQVIASTSAGTIIRAPGDPKTIEKKAQETGVSTCFAESDFCTIMTPLTPFRGHDHKAHERSGRGPHEHDAPDPPLDWGVTPPEMVIRLE